MNTESVQLFFFTDKADDITAPIKCMVTESTVHITWQEPAAPNGMIILYEVNYKRLGDTEVKTETHHLHTHLSSLDCSSDVSLVGY